MKLIAYNAFKNMVFEMEISKNNSFFITQLLSSVHPYVSLMFERDISIEEAVNVIFESEKISIGGNVMFVQDDDIDVESEMSNIIGLNNRPSLNYAALNINNPNSILMFFECL